MLFLHDQVLREYGGAQGLKSEDLLGSAPVQSLAREAGRMLTTAAAGQPGSVSPDR